MKNSKIPEMLLFETEITSHNIFVSENEFENFRMHGHDFYEFEYVLEGSGKCFINGQEYSFKKGDVAFVTPLDVHGYSGNGRMKLLSVHFLSNGIDGNLMGICNMDACVIKAEESMQNVLEILRNANQEDGMGGMLAEKALEMIVILFLQIVKNDRIKNMPREISYAVKYINTNFKRKLDLEEVSKIVGYSKEHFCRQFKRYTGMSFLEYLSHVRVVYGRNLIVNNGLSATEACFECGFGSLRSFNRVFAEKYGCSPKKYAHQYLS